MLTEEYMKKPRHNNAVGRSRIVATWCVNRYEYTGVAPKIAAANSGIMPKEIRSCSFRYWVSSGLGPPRLCRLAKDGSAAWPMALAAKEMRTTTVEARL